MPETDFAPEIPRGEPEPRTVDDAREQISDTRHRISDTLDELELRIADTKQDIRRRADVLRPVRERIRLDPWKALAIGAGAGLVIGFLSGGSDKKETRARERARARARHARLRHAHRDERLDGRARVGAEGARRQLEHAPDRVGSRASSRPGPEGERLLGHLVRSFASAVSEGISERFRRGATS